LVVDLNLPDAVFVRLTVPLGLSKTRLGIRLSSPKPDQRKRQSSSWWNQLMKKIGGA
jgi:hypothetical protein